MILKEITRRYITFTISVLIIALGLSAIVRSNLGTSPISSSPYVFSINTSLTIGTYLFILCLIFILVQMLLLGKEGIKKKKIELIAQVPISFIFGLCTDITMWILSDLNPDSYHYKMITLIVGCFILAFGICLEVIADVLMMGGELTVQIAATKFKKEFGTVKIIFDVTLVVIALISSLIFSSNIEGIREGTIITAIITGPFVKIIMPRLNFIRNWQTANSQITNLQEVANSKAVLITISREYGSGGHEIGKEIAKRLNIPFYDKNLIGMVANEGGFSKEFVSENEQHLKNPMLYKMIFQDYEAPLEKSISPEDILFVTQSKVISRIAEEGSCVIVGRCANFILNKYHNNINIFIHADLAFKKNRIISHYGVDPNIAENEIIRIDKARKEHYNFYTGKTWGDSKNYQLSCDSSIISTEEICDIIEKIYHKIN